MEFHQDNFYSKGLKWLWIWNNKTFENIRFQESCIMYVWFGPNTISIQLSGHPMVNNNWSNSIVILAQRDITVLYCPKPANPLAVYWKSAKASKQYNFGNNLFFPPDLAKMSQVRLNGDQTSLQTSRDLNKLHSFRCLCKVTTVKKDIILFLAL